jgi:hypothetical protein
VHVQTFVTDISQMFMSSETDNGYIQCCKYPLFYVRPYLPSSCRVNEFSSTVHIHRNTRHRVYLKSKQDALDTVEMSCGALLVFRWVQSLFFTSFTLDYLS